MFTWDEVIERYKVFERGAKGLERGALAGCMVQMLPSLREAVEKHFPNARLSLSMLAVELRLAETSQTVVVQCVEQCLFELTLTDSQYEVLQEEQVGLSNVVEQIIKLLDMSKSVSKKDQ